MKNSIYICLGILVFSCSQTENKNNLTTSKPDPISKIDDALIDSIITVLDSNSVEDYEENEELAQKEVIEKVYGKQWDFCDCIQKTDSIQKAIDNVAEISDSDFDKIMNRFDEIDQHCKAIITSPNTTPEERKAHERKVKKCLKKL
ncbi:MAG: hypothetical protein AB8B72_02310 [Crocinitomicaceae bacterium]